MNYWRLVAVSPNLWWLYGGGLFLITYIYSTELTKFYYSPIFWMYFIYFTISLNKLITGWYFLSQVTSQTNKTVTSKPIKSEVKIWLGISISMLILILLSQPPLTVSFLLSGQILLAYLLYRSPWSWVKHSILQYTDSLLYVTPALVGLGLSTKLLSLWQLSLGIIAWSVAQSLFINENPTNKTVLLLSGSLYAFFCLYVISAGSNHWLGWMSLIYPLLVLVTLVSNQDFHRRLVYLLPYLNFGYGLLLYGGIVWQKI